ncbi:MAG: glycosyltransferase family 2 protein, partial [Beijerinckiaceae bacterium]
VWLGGLRIDQSTRAIAAESRLLSDAELPVYSILVPMFREPEVLPILAKALSELDYPQAKLDIKIVLEEGDSATIDAARALKLPPIFEIILVPPSQPQTKPKACNYALPFARGDFLVIFDAEDKPEPDQLRKVVAAFRRAPASTACMQCRLNYYNARENWLTRQFTLDYSLWFDAMLPGLYRLNAPIPLGGTSNHFRIEVLRALNAWDPFNVTEDADLGIRLSQAGYRVGVVDSTTYEEANVSIGNWIRQRSRWIKGYMQTFLVHMRHPLHLWRTVGTLGFLSFVFFIGGTMLSGLINPIFWGIFIIWLITLTSGFDDAFPGVLLHFSLFNLIVGNGMFIYLTLLAPLRRGWFDLVPTALTVFGYWVLMSVAAYKALFQLVTNPFYWEKTTHGLSKQTQRELESLKRSEVASAPVREALKPEAAT